MPTQARPTYDGTVHSNSADGNENYFDLGGVRYDLGHGVENSGYTSGADGRGPTGATVAALMDPNSTMSSNLSYGGSAGAANSQMGDLRGAGVAAYNRADPNWDTSQSDQSRGMAGVLGSQLSGLAAGDPNSQAQQQLANGYASANSALRSQTASTQGGPLAAAAARRAASSQIGLNDQQKSVASKDLMAQQQMNAYGQLAGFGGQLRGTDQANAFGKTDAAMHARRINDAEQARNEAMRFNIGTLAGQGQQNRRADMATYNGIMAGQDQTSSIIADKHTQQNTGAVMGGIESGLSAASGLASSYSNSESPTIKKSDWNN